MKKKILIIGSGPAALMLAAQLDENLFEIFIAEKNAAPARKFLVAGDGGFNLTHSENIETLITRYTPAGFLDKTLRAFSNEDLVRFLGGIGIPTFSGSSKRVFPEKGIKPIDVLNAFLNLLKKKNVQFLLKHEWKGWSDQSLVFSANGETVLHEADYFVFALGGASWPVTGSDGGWTNMFAEKNIRIIPFSASNCAMRVDWPELFFREHEGKPLKNIAVRCNGKEKKGELVITRLGLEGGAVYFFSPEIRQELEKNNFAEIQIDLRPDLSLSEIEAKLEKAKGKSRSAILKSELGLDSPQMSLLKFFLPKADFNENKKTAAAIKSITVRITGLAPVEEAISTAGGIALEEMDEDFQLKKMPGTFTIGEMSDWDAPTGGYLLQACFSMGHSLAEYLNKANSQ